MPQQNTDTRRQAQPATITPAQVAVLLDPDARSWIKLPMPVLLGEWVRAPVYKSTHRATWCFDLTPVGRDVAARARALTEAANAALAAYLGNDKPGAQATCMTGSFRDGFARGADWQRRKGSP